MLLYYDSRELQSSALIAKDLSDMLEYGRQKWQPLIFLCIGSDRSTGDSLGPLIGYKLSHYRHSGVYVYGTLNNPVHAVNLVSTINLIKTRFQNPYIVAIDASLGHKEHIGFITLANGALKPGLGVKKELPEVGDIHITGIVNLSGSTDAILLQTTRLSTIMTIADVIAESILYVLDNSFITCQVSYHPA